MIIRDHVLQFNCLLHSSFPCPHHACLWSTTDHFLFSSQHCSILSMDQQSLCALHAHPWTLSSSNLTFLCLVLTQNKKNNTLCICHTPWSAVVRSEMDSKSFLFLHSGACLFDNDDGKMIRFRHTSCWPRTLAPAPLRLAQWPSGSSCCFMVSLVSSG